MLLGSLDLDLQAGAQGPVVRRNLQGGILLQRIYLERNADRGATRKILLMEFSLVAAGQYYRLK